MKWDGKPESLPDPLPDNSQYWTLSEANGAERFLRPKWNLPWNQNKSQWGAEAVERLRQTGHEYSLQMSEQKIATTPSAEIESAFEKAFLSWRKAWKKKQTSPEEKAASNQATRRHGRKVKVEMH